MYKRWLSSREQAQAFQSPHGKLHDRKENTALNSYAVIQEKFDTIPCIHQQDPTSTYWWLTWRFIFAHRMVLCPTLNRCTATRGHRCQGDRVDFNLQQAILKARGSVNRKPSTPAKTYGQSTKRGEFCIHTQDESHLFLHFLNSIFFMFYPHFVARKTATSFWDSMISKESTMRPNYSWGRLAFVPFQVLRSKGSASLEELKVKLGRENWQVMMSLPY